MQDKTYQAKLPKKAYSTGALYEYARKWHEKNCKDCKKGKACNDLDTIMHISYGY